MIAWALLSPDAWASAGNVPTLSGTIVHDSARLTFEWPQETHLQVSADGRILTVTFDRKADPDFGSVLKNLYPYVTSARRKADGKTIVFTLNKPYRIRTFASETINGVELLDIAPAKKLAALSPAAGEEKTEPAAEPTAEAKPETVAAPEEAPPAPPADVAEKPAEETPPAVEPEPAQAAAEEKKPEPQAVAAGGGDSQTLSPELAQAVVEKPTDRVIVGVSPAADNVVLRFPFAERKALAAFIRGRALWVVWQKPLPADLSDFENLPRTVIGKAEVVQNKDATIIRMPVDDGMFVNVAKEENSFDWAVLVTPKKRELVKPLAVQVNSDPPVPAHVFIPCLEMAEPVTVTDPEVGDQLMVTPFYSVGEGMLQPRMFLEFALLPTAQGVVVVKKSDDATVIPLRNGLRVSLPQGATVTPGLSNIEQAQSSSDALQQAVTLFPYDEWKPADPEQVTKQARELFRRVVESETPQEANTVRLRIAQLYLSQGLAAEALGFLDGINRVNPAFYRSSKLAALRGAANFLMHRFVDASKDLSAAELNNNKEIDYWRSMLADLLGNPDQSYDYLALNADYISKYPPIFRQRLAIVAADRSIGGKDYNTALKILDTLTQDNLAESIGSYVNFLMAKVSADTGQEKEATEMWDKLAEDYDHPFVQARAEFSRLLFEMEKENLPKDKAIERLEHLRLNWHGDSLEISVLTMLGDAYADQKDYVNAMRVWHAGITGFPNTTMALDMSRKIQEAFITMFSEGIADSLSPLDALALYYEYQNYTPTGNTGNEIINRLADRLVSVDLLNQASTLLDHQMRHSAEKEKRSEIGARLATVYLLNHQPNKALQALQESVYGDNSLMLRLWRNRLTAQAMVDLGQYDKVLVTLGQDNTPDAERIRIDVYWQDKDWPKLISSVETLLKTRKDITAPVTIDESEYLLRLALAYVFQNDRTQLQYLHDYFGPLMEKNPNKPVFDFITGGDIQLTTTNFDEVIKNITDTRSFIDNYRAHVETAGLEKDGDAKERAAVPGDGG